MIRSRHRLRFASPVARRLVVVALVAAAAAGSLGRADAEDGGTSAAAADDGWVVSIGGTSQLSPNYTGAGKYGLSAMPSLSFRRPGEPIEFSAPDDGIDYTLFSTPYFKLGPVANLQFGRSSGDDPRLVGLGPIPWTLEAGLFAEVWPVPGSLRTRLEVRHGLGSRDGLVADLSADLVRPFGAFILSGGPRFSFASAQAMQQQFGVTTLQSLSNGLVAPYYPKGGPVSVGAAAALSYDWSPQWRTTAFTRYDRLVDQAAASPITRQFGTANQFTVGLGVTYSFTLSGADLPAVLR